MTDWRRCHFHPDVNPDTMYGCPDCSAELRRMVIRLLDVLDGVMQNHFHNKMIFCSTCTDAQKLSEEIRKAITK